MKLFFGLILYIFCLTQAAFAQSVGPLFTEFLLFDQSIGGASNPVNLQARWQVAQITAGGTFNGGTFHVQISGDGSTYANADCYSTDGLTTFSSNGWITAAGVWRCNVSGANFIRGVRSSGSGGTTRITATASTIGNTLPVGSVGSLNPLTDPIPQVTLYDTAPTPPATVSRHVAGYQMVLLTATGTFSGATFGIQTSNDNVNFAATDCYVLTGGTALVTSNWLNATGVWRCNISGASWMRATLASGTPGTLKITGQLSLIGFAKPPGTGAAAGGGVTDFSELTGVASDAQIPNLNTLSTGLAPSLCVTTDSSSHLAVAACTTGGTVTSIALTAPPQFSITGSPITTSGTLSMAWANVSQNFGLHGPTSGSGVPTFRAMVKADMPATTVHTDQGNTWTGFDQNMALAASLTVPTATGAAPTANGRIAFDSTAAITSQSYKVGIGGATWALALVNGNLGTFSGTFTGTATGYQPLATPLTQFAAATTGANRYFIHTGTTWISKVMTNCNGANESVIYDDVIQAWGCHATAGGLTGGTVGALAKYLSVGTPSTLGASLISESGATVRINATTVEQGDCAATFCLSELNTYTANRTRTRKDLSGYEVVANAANLTSGRCVEVKSDGSVGDSAGGCAGAPAADSITVAMVQAPLKTHSLFIPIGDRVLGSALIDTQDYPIVWRNNVAAMTVTEVWCQTDAGTAIINLTRDDGSPANILSSNLSCNTTGITGTIAGAEDNIAVGDKIGFVMVTAGGTAKEVNISIKLTLD